MKKFVYILLSVFILASSAIAADAVDVKDIYRFYCAQCHGLQGRGDGINNREEMPVTPRDHTSSEEMGKLSDEEIISVIKEGGAATSKSTLMPPFMKTLTEEEIVRLKDYLRELCKC